MTARTNCPAPESVLHWLLTPTDHVRGQRGFEACMAASHIVAAAAIKQKCSAHDKRVQQRTAPEELTVLRLPMRQLSPMLE